MNITKLLTGTAAPAILAMLLAGCATNDTAPYPPDARVPATTTPATGQVVQDTMAPEASVEEVKHFNISITADGSELADPVRRSVEGRLADAGYRIIPDTRVAPDITVKLSVADSVFDRAGGNEPGDNGVNYTGYVRYEGTVTADITRAWDGKKIGFEPVSIRGKRGLGDAEGRRNLTEQLVEQATPIIVNAARPELTGLAVNDIVIKRPWLASHDLKPNMNSSVPWITSNDPEYVQNFIAGVKNMSGVIYCALVAEDYESSTLTFRIVYLADAMPGGLVNRLALSPQFQIYHIKQ